MIIATHQPIFLPWAGFFRKALGADAMVLLDDVQFPLGRSWMTRNRLKSDKGELWLRVPVWKTGRGKQSIRDVEICAETDWRTAHLRSLRHQYANAPYLNDHLPALEAIISQGHRKLIELNVALIRYLWETLGMQSRLLLQSDLEVQGKGTDLLIALCRQLDADRYVSLAVAEKHLNMGAFRRSGIKTTFAPYQPPVYPQLWGDFRYNLSTLDLLLNCGPKSVDLVARSAH